MTFKLALVTGASSGIGEALAYLLADCGINLILTARNQVNLHHLADRLREKVNVVVYPADLADAKQRAKLLRKVHELTPDLVINNAGLGFYGEAAELDTAKQTSMIEVNCEALTEISLEAVKAMVGSRVPGVVLNVSSVAAFMPFPYFSVYAATKAYVNSFSLALNNEVAPHGVSVLTACPGQVWTNFSLRASGGETIRKDEEKKMSPQFAAMQIWRQIQKRKVLHTFDGKYRAVAFLAQYLLPRRLLMWTLKKVMHSRVNTF